MLKKKRFAWLSLLLVLGLVAAACSDDDEPTSSGDTTDTSGDGGDCPTDVEGDLVVSGSSTVEPIATAVGEKLLDCSDIAATVDGPGTGDGFELFCAGETDISDASRPIKPDEEVPVCKKNGVTYQEVQIANDGIAVVTNKGLKIDCMTTAELKKLWNQGSKITTYNQINPKFPDTKVSLFGPGTDSGTFDFFTAEINGEEGVSRKEYQPSEDDNVLVQGVEGDEGGLGYFGFSYYEQNQDKLNLVAIDAGDGCVKPSTETIQDGSYKPLSRPLFMYPSEKSMAKAQVKGFMDYVIANQAEIAKASQIVPLTSAQLDKAKDELKKAEANAG